jgi:hypothetical protein
VTEIDAGHKTPEAATASGVFYAIFQSENKKMDGVLQIYIYDDIIEQNRQKRYGTHCLREEGYAGDI